VQWFELSIYSQRPRSNGIESLDSYLFFEDYQIVSQDLLLLLEPGFTDPKYPGERFICPDGAPIEGLLASDPSKTSRLDIHRLPFARPREAVVAALDADHQSLPVLILGDEHPVPADAQTLGDKRFVTDTRRILDLLAERHGFPKVH
jgi:hypothetical protein